MKTLLSTSSLFEPIALESEKDFTDSLILLNGLGNITLESLHQTPAAQVQLNKSQGSQAGSGSGLGSGSSSDLRPASSTAQSSTSKHQGNDKALIEALMKLRQSKPAFKSSSIVKSSIIRSKKD